MQIKEIYLYRVKRERSREREGEREVEREKEREKERERFLLNTIKSHIYLYMFDWVDLSRMCLNKEDTNVDILVIDIVNGD